MRRNGGGGGGGECWGPLTQEDGREKANKLGRQYAAWGQAAEMQVLTRRTSCWKAIPAQRGRGQAPTVREIGADKVAPCLREKKWPERATSAKDAARVWESAASAIGDLAEMEHGGARGDRERGRACHRLWCLVPRLPEADCSGVCYGERGRGDWAAGRAMQVRPRTARRLG